MCVTVQVTNRTEARWPAADVLVEYLQDFSQAQVEAGAVHFGVEVIRIARASSPRRFSMHPSFEIHLESASGGGEQGRATADCGSLVLATGLPTPNKRASVHGLEHAEGYEDLPETGKPFVGQTVAVLGAGNAGFEVADALAPYVNYVHVWLGRGEKQRNEMVSWESRYVGDLRAINAGLLDAYLLKSIDGALNKRVTVTSFSIHLCGEGRRKKCLFLKGPSEGSLLLGSLNKHDSWAVQFVEALGGARVSPVLVTVLWTERNCAVGDAPALTGGIKPLDLTATCMHMLVYPATGDTGLVTSLVDSERRRIPQWWCRDLTVIVYPVPRPLLGVLR